jgi:hypothetical protein
MSLTNTYNNMSASGSALAGAGNISGMMCNKITAGAIDLIDNTIGTSGTYIIKGFVPTVGYYPLGNVNCIKGCYASLHGVMDFTMYIKATD